jgi:hypothetical protein
VVSNISLAGLRLEVGSRLVKGEILELQFRDPALRSVACQVQWCRRLPKKETLLAGVSFTATLAQLRGTWLIEALEALDTIGAYYQGLAPPIVQPPLSEAFSSEPAPEIVVEVEATASLEEPTSELLTESQVAEIADACRLSLSASEHPGAETGELSSANKYTAFQEVSHLVAPPARDEAWAQLLHDAQLRLKQASPLLTRVLSGLRAFAVEDGVSLVERRRIRRMRCQYEVVCHLGAQSFRALVVDLSPAGLGLETAFTFRKGTVFSVLAPELPEFSGFAPMVGKVRHVKLLQHRVGLVLEPTDLLRSWVGISLRTLGFSRAHLEEKRRFVRARTYLAVEARGWGGDFVKGFFLDLGRGGALLQSPQAFQREEQVRLVVGPLGPLPLLYLPGLVVNQRRDPDSAGWLVSVRFLELTKRRMSQLDQYILALLTSNPSLLESR